MVFNWKEYLNLAQYLQGKPDASYSEESARRASVSRAYYAAFCFARNYAHDKYGRDKRMKSRKSEHTDLRDYYIVLGTVNRKLGDIADNLDELRQWRNFCDYDDDVMQNIDDLANNALDNAREIINALED